MNIEYALKLAIRIHEGQVDKAGKPYILHPLAVWHRVRFESVEVQIVAILHDTIEDTTEDKGLLYDEILAHFGPTILNAVVALSRREDETYAVYVARAAQDPIARKVKKADLEENMSPERVASLPEKDRSIVNRYKKAYAVVTGIS